MNERIRQLADQAHEYASGVYNQRIATEGPENVFFYQISNDKFAELIVRECADIATMNQHKWASAGSYVLEHFGVKL
jgi:hypothetical protein